MHAHGFRPMHRRQTLAALTVFSLFSVVAGCGLVAGTVPSSAKEGTAGTNVRIPQGMPGPTGEDIDKEFNDDDLKMKGEKPRGKWGFATVLDLSQFGSSSIPVRCHSGI